MRKSIIYIVISLLLVVIVANQLFWIVNMYNTYEKELILNMNTELNTAGYMEVSERSERGGGFTSYAMYSGVSDTSRYIQKKIRTQDTVFLVTIDRQDPNANLKIAQTGLKDTIPLNVFRLNELFFKKIQEGKFPIKDTYIEYYDLEGDSLLASSREGWQSSSYMSSDTIVLDIVKTMGVKAYANNPIVTILERMLFQLILSVILCVFAVLFLIFLGRTIFRQWKEEKMRQDSVNAMTHEFKRPIHALMGLVSRIPDYAKKNNTEKVVQYATLAMEELNRLTLYTQRIQQISNNDKATIRLDKSEVEIAPFMEALRVRYDSSENPANEKHYHKTIELNVGVHTKHSVLHVDKSHFMNVMENLIENAIKYSGERLIIDLSVGDENKYLCISVKDNGIGIAASDRKWVFDKFYRADNRSVKRTAGYGLGLTYVKSIAKAHGGSIEVNSPGVGKGSEFVLLMPVYS